MFNSNASSADAGGGIPYIEDVFSTWLYTGTGAAQTITNEIDLAGEGGLVWIKSRSTGGTLSQSHYLFDSARGYQYVLSTNTTNGEYGPSGANEDITSFNSNGFSLGAIEGTSNVNINGTTFASWTFREQPKFFDVVTYTGNGVNNRQIAHSLGSEPGCIIIKMTTAANDWAVYHRSLGSGKWIRLNTTAAQATNSSAFPSVTSTTFTPTSDVTGFSMNDNGVGYVAYLFAHNAGGFGLTGTDNVISCGSYTGNGSTTGPVIDLGYEPQWVMIKRTDAANSWYVHDNMRGMTYESNTATWLVPNTSAAEVTSTTTDAVMPTATGFQIGASGANWNEPDGTYIYIAIRRGPMKVPTDGTSVFSLDTMGSTAPRPPAFKASFPVDWSFYKNKSIEGAIWAVADRLRGATYLNFSSADAETDNASFRFDYQNGYATNTTTDSDIQSWMFRRAPGFFDEVCYTGTGSDVSIAHNLQTVPQMAIIKRRNGVAGWVVGSPLLSNTAYGFLNDTAAFITSGGNAYFQNTAWSDQFLYLRTDQDVNDSGNSYVAYLFASAPGVSKVGSYTGTATTQVINCGFTGGARFVLIKRTDSTGDWYVWDSARGIVAGNDPYLLLNSTAAEVTSTDYVDTAASGFELTATAPAAINASGGTYIFLAIA
jgi:hypothetical protein